MSSRRRFVRAPSPGPSWATLPNHPASSTASSDKEGSPVPTASSKAARKRKNSPKPTLRQRKKPKVAHSATWPVPPTRCVPTDSKGKQRSTSQGPSSGSNLPDFDGLELIINSSQGVSPAPASSSKSMTSTMKRKTVGGMRSMTKQTSVLAPTSKLVKRSNVTSVSVSTRTLITGRGNTPQVDGDVIDLSDSDDNQPVLADDNAIIDTTQLDDSDESTLAPSPSKSVPMSISSARTRSYPRISGIRGSFAGATSRGNLTAPSPRVKEVNGVFEILDSDDEDAYPPSRASTSRVESFEPPIPPPSSSIAGKEVIRSPFDIFEPRLVGIEHTPPLEFPPSPQHDIGMDVDVDPLPPVISAQENISSGIRAECAVSANAWSFSPKVVESTSQTKSPGPAAVDNTRSFSSPPVSAVVLLFATPNNTEPPAPTPLISSSLHSPILATNSVVSPLPSLPKPPRLAAEEFSIRHSSPTSARFPRVDPSQMTSDPMLPPDSAHAESLPRRSFVSQIRIDPSVPPHPAANAIDWGPRHHGPDGLFRHVLKRSGLYQNHSLSYPTTSNNLSARTLECASFRTPEEIGMAVEKIPATVNSGDQTDGAPSALTTEGEVQATMETDSVSAHPVYQSSDKGSPPTTDPYRSQDVIVQPDRPCEAIDLTLSQDDDDDEEHENGRWDHQVDTIPASVLRGARWLDALLAMESDLVRLESLSRVTSPNQIDSVSSPPGSHAMDSLVSQTSLNDARDEVNGSMCEASSTKPKIFLDNIRSIWRKPTQVKLGNKTTDVTVLTEYQTESTPSVIAPPRVEQFPIITATSSLRTSTVVDALVGDVGALSMSHDPEDAHVAIPADEDASEDGSVLIRKPAYGKRLAVTDDTSSSEGDTAEDCELTYPADADADDPNELPSRNETIRGFSRRFPSSPPFTRAFSRLSSLSSSLSNRSSSGDSMNLKYNSYAIDDVDAYGPQSGNCSSGDLSEGDSPYITWRIIRRAARERLPKFLKTQDLPHTLQDYLNALPERCRASDQARVIFEAAMRESTADDEPDAPAIRIFNEIDNEITPPWEFHYTNKMWHGEGVPGPDLKTLRGCDCEGRCDPKSKTCLCVQKQTNHLDTSRVGFVYDHRGRLIEPLINYPIFECNDFCGCGVNCQNRVVQLGRKCQVNIVKTKEKGWGVFAGNKRIPAGTFVGIYAGELLQESVGEERGTKYNAFGKTYLFDIDGYHLREDDPDWEVSYTVDAYHAGNFTRFLNHSCEPNCMIMSCYINDGDMEKPLIAIFTRDDVEAWGELCFSYSGFVSEEDVAVAAVGATQMGKGAVYIPCRCNAPTCKGVMFK